MQNSKRVDQQVKNVSKYSLLYALGRHELCRSLLHVQGRSTCISSCCVVLQHEHALVHLFLRTLQRQ